MVTGSISLPQITLKMWLTLKTSRSYLDIDNDIHIPTTDEHGNVTWGQVHRDDSPRSRYSSTRSNAGRKSVIV
jgi:hypothetical protein